MRERVWGELDHLAALTAGGVAHALVLRARAVLGDDTAAADLRRAVTDLRAPGLLLGL